MPVHIQILPPGFMKTKLFFLLHKQTVPSGKAMLGMGYADTGKEHTAKEHTARFLEKVIEPIL